MESQAGNQPRLTKLCPPKKRAEVPESVLYDEKHQIVYVSNIRGKSTLKNNKGFMAKVGLDGSIKILNWVTGLNALKGMGIFGDMLYVTNFETRYLYSNGCFWGMGLFTSLLGTIAVDQCL